MMDEGKITPTPWRVEESDKYPSFTCIAHLGDVSAPGEKPRIMWVQGLDVAMRDEWEANARRIVACVNVLEGIPTEALETALELMAFDDRPEPVTERDRVMRVLNNIFEVAR